MENSINQDCQTQCHYIIGASLDDEKKDYFVSLLCFGFRLSTFFFMVIRGRCGLDLWEMRIMIRGGCVQMINVVTACILLNNTL